MKKKSSKLPGTEKQGFITGIAEKMDCPLVTPLNPKHQEAVRLQKRLRKYRRSILTFSHYQNLPSDNASERAIRKIKVKQKVSGQFKSVEGADRFCVIRSVVDPLIKRSQNIFENLNYITHLQPE